MCADAVAGCPHLRNSLSEVGIRSWMCARLRLVLTSRPVPLLDAAAACGGAPSCCVTERWHGNRVELTCRPAAGRCRRRDRESRGSASRVSHCAPRRTTAHPRGPLRTPPAACEVCRGGAKSGRSEDRAPRRATAHPAGGTRGDTRGCGVGEGTHRRRCGQPPTMRARQGMWWAPGRGDRRESDVRGDRTPPASVSHRSRRGRP
jgi:hypothetical protein